MKQQTRLLLIIVTLSAFLFLSAVFFVILFFRIFPDRFTLVFPSALVFGGLLGLLVYLPARYFIEKN